MALVEKSFEEIITFTRASEATYFGSDGLMKTAAVDEPRIDYDPITLEKKGLLMEERRTNICTWSSDLTKFIKRADTIVTGNAGTGLTAGYTKIQNDVSLNGIHSLQTTELSANRHFSTSVYLASVEGNTTAKIWLKNWNGGDVDVGLICDLTTTPKRFDLYRQYGSGAVGSPYMDITPGEVGVPILANYVNLEEGKFPTSFINTTIASVTRQQDIAKVFDASEWTCGPKVGTYVVEYELPDDNVNRFADYPRALGSDTTSFAAIAATTDKRVETWNGATSVEAIAPVSSTLHKAAVTFDISGRAIAVNGAYNSGTGLFQDVLNNITLMASGNGFTPITGWIKSVDFYPYRFTQQEMIDATKPFNPIQIFNTAVGAWYEMSDSEYVLGSKAPQLTDKTGNGYHSTQATVQYQPTVGKFSDILGFEWFNTPQDGKRLIYPVDVYMLLNWQGPTGDYWIYHWSLSDRQYYRIRLTNGTRFPGLEAIGIIVTDRQLTDKEIRSLDSWYSAQWNYPMVENKPNLVAECGNTTINSAGQSVGTSAITWEWPYSNQISNVPNFPTVTVSERELMLCTVAEPEKMSNWGFQSYKIIGTAPDLKPFVNLRGVSLANNNFYGEFDMPEYSNFNILIGFAVNGTKLSGYAKDLTIFPNLTNIEYYSSDNRGPQPKTTGLQNITNIYDHNCQFEGEVENMDHLTKLTIWYDSSNRYVGNIPNLINCIKLDAVFLGGNKFTNIVSGFGVPPILRHFDATSNQLPQSAIDAILKAFVDAGRVDVGGTSVIKLEGVGNAAPSATGIGYKNTLISRGFAVTTN